MVAIRRALEPQETGAAKERQGTRTDQHLGNFSGGNAIDKVAEFTGVSGRTLDKATAVVKAAEADPKKFGHLVEEMDRTGKVTGAYRKVRMADDEARIMSIQPVEGKHRTIVMDPPLDRSWAPSDTASRTVPIALWEVDSDLEVSTTVGEHTFLVRLA